MNKDQMTILYLNEAQNILSQLHFYLSIAHTSKHQEVLFRLFHTMKGSTSSIGQNEILNLLHQCEDLLVSQPDKIIAVLIKIEDELKELEEKLSPDSIDKEKLYSMEAISYSLHELFSGLGKNIELDFVFEEGIKLEKDQFKALKDSFIQLVLNSVEHGFKYKDEGQIIISIDQNFNILYEDNGLGLNIKKLVERAIEQGYLGKAHIDNEDISRFVFEKGLSTNSKVNTLSGRGVGMWMVKQILDEVGLKITVDTVFDQGVRFYISP